MALLAAAIFLLCEAFDPLDPAAPSRLRTGRLMELVVRNPNVLVRVPFDLSLAVLLIYAGLWLAKGIGSPFVLDRWKPPTTD